MPSWKKDTKVGALVFFLNNKIYFPQHIKVEGKSFFHLGQKVGFIGSYTSVLGVYFYFESVFICADIVIFGAPHFV